MCLEIDWKEVRVTISGNEVNLATLVILPFEARKLVRRQPLLLHVMLKQGKIWFTLENDNRNQNATTSDA